MNENLTKCEIYKTIYTIFHFGSLRQLSIVIRKITYYTEIKLNAFFNLDQQQKFMPKLILKVQIVYTFPRVCACVRANAVTMKVTVIT